MSEHAYIRWFEQLQLSDVPVVGGKNASLGEMMRALRGEGVRVPEGFAITTDAHWVLLGTSGIGASIAAERRNRKMIQKPGAETRHAHIFTGDHCGGSAADHRADSWLAR